MDVSCVFSCSACWYRAARRTDRPHKLGTLASPQGKLFDLGNPQLLCLASSDTIDFGLAYQGELCQLTRIFSPEFNWATL